MARVKNVKTARARHKKVLKQAKGYEGSKSVLYKTANEQVMRSMRYQYRDRRQRKREFRKLWITRINAAAQLNDLKYSQLIFGLKLAEIDIDRKILADIAVNDPKTFTDICKEAKKAIKNNKPTKSEDNVIRYLELEKQEKPNVKPKKVSPKKETKKEEVKKAKPQTKKEAKQVTKSTKKLEETKSIKKVDTKEVKKPTKTEDIKQPKQVQEEPKKAPKKTITKKVVVVKKVSGTKKGEKILPTTGELKSKVEKGIVSDKKELQIRTVAELKDICRKYNIQGYSGLKKAELVNLIFNALK